jgi:HEPN domain-containing protein
VIERRELRKIARARLVDSEALYRARRYDGAVYLCGYAVEVALKARICQTLHWPDFPVTPREFQNLQSFKVHNLDALLRLSGREIPIKAKLFAEWSIIATWDPEVRYKEIGTAGQADALDMIEAARALLKAL